MSDVKHAVRRVLIRYRQRYGLEAAVRIGKSSLKQYIDAPGSLDGRTFHTDFNGEVCETVLEMLIDDYMRSHSGARDWKMNRNVVLSDPTKPRGNKFLTEIDLFLMTPQCFYIFECKSYAGVKILRDRGLLVRGNGSSCDVYRQNALHLETVRKWLDRLSCCPRYQMVMFDFSNGKLKDERAPEARCEMPCFNETDLQDLFREKRDSVWDAVVISRIHELLSRETDQLRRRHLEYVKSLRK